MDIDDNWKCPCQNLRRHVLGGLLTTTSKGKSALDALLTAVCNELHKSDFIFSCCVAPRTDLARRLKPRATTGEVGLRRLYNRRRAALQEGNL
jgi:hypothetical protein